MKKLENLGRSLSKKEQKKIIGGFVDPGDGGGGGTHCECDGSVGAWTYTSMPTCAGALQDIRTYCRSGFGHCSGSCSL